MIGVGVNWICCASSPASGRPWAVLISTTPSSRRFSRIGTIEATRSISRSRSSTRPAVSRPLAEKIWICRFSRAMRPSATFTSLTWRAISASAVCRTRAPSEDIWFSRTATSRAALAEAI